MSQAKEGLCQNKFDGQNVQKASVCPLNKSGKDKSDKPKIGIFERTRAVFPENRGLARAKGESKMAKPVDNAPTQNKLEKCRLDKAGDKTNESTSIKIESAKKASPKQTPENKGSLDYENNENEMRPEGKFARKRQERLKNESSLRKTSLERSVHLVQGFAESKKNVGKGKNQKELDSMTVHTCNTVREMSQLQIEEESPQRKYRLVKLSKLQKHFVAYNGNYWLKFHNTK